MSPTLNESHAILVWHARGCCESASGGSVTRHLLWGEDNSMQKDHVRKREMPLGRWAPTAFYVMNIALWLLTGILAGAWTLLWLMLLPLPGLGSISGALVGPGDDGQFHRHAYY
jgi:hypothetical protein